VGYTYYLPAKEAREFVDEEWRDMVPETDELINIYSPDMKLWRIGVYGLETSFELGIKVGDEWYFDGDMFDLVDRPEVIYQLHYELLIAAEVYYWELKAKHDMIDIKWAIEQCRARCISNIHDKENGNA
jgi:hypothetical protein